VAYTITSKRKLNSLIEQGVVNGWDDPRMPTIAGLRRRGYPAAALREFVKRGGVTKKDKLIEMGVLENCVREELGDQAERRLAVLRPLKVVLTNYPDDQVEMMEGLNHPNRPELGTREVPFSRELWDDNGEVIELRCTYDPDTRSGTGTSDRKVKGTIHWVSAAHAVPASVRLYDRLFTVPDPNAADDFMAVVNADSLAVVEAMLEPALQDLPDGEAVQFERLGYFCTDSKDHAADAPVFNRIVTLRDSWAKIEKQAMQQGGRPA
jgi:glutaminyl-tRNA synthetase